MSNLWTPIEDYIFLLSVIWLFARRNAIYFLFFTWMICFLFMNFACRLYMSRETERERGLWSKFSYLILRQRIYSPISCVCVWQNCWTKASNDIRFISIHVYWNESCSQKSKIISVMANFNHRKVCQKINLF